MKNPKFKNHHNAEKFSFGYEFVDTTIPDSAVPNQAMTIREIYSRFASGRSLSGVKTPEYDDDGSRLVELSLDDYMPDLNTIDLADRQEILENAKIQLDTVKKKLDGIAKARKQQRDNEVKDLQKRIKELEQKQEKPNNNAPEA